MKLAASCKTAGMTAPVIGRITRSGRDVVDRSNHILLVDDESPDSTEGFAAVMVQHGTSSACRVPLAYHFSELDYLCTGDVVMIDPRGFIRTLYRRHSAHNSILMTDQCNSFCLMCSQPPKLVDDRNRVAEHLQLIELIDPETAELGITGGEPTLFDQDFLSIVDSCRRHLPKTALHVLTNGRAFFYRSFARQLGEIGHPELVLGIPLYSSIDSRHDFLVQSAGAFEETVLGLHHLAEFGVAVEIRVVIHAQTYDHLPMLSEFICRNLPFAKHVALMGLEMFGFTRPNIDRLWVDPVEYQRELQAAVEILALGGMNVSIYNHQLCTLSRELWPFAVRSISDWKNVYFDECGGCSVRESCGGFFESAGFRRSAHIRPVPGAAIGDRS